MINFDFVMPGSGESACYLATEVHGRSWPARRTLQRDRPASLGLFARVSIKRFSLAAFFYLAVEKTVKRQEIQSPTPRIDYERLARCRPIDEYLRVNQMISVVMRSRVPSSTKIAEAESGALLHAEVYIQLRRISSPE